MRLTALTCALAATHVLAGPCDDEVVDKIAKCTNPKACGWTYSFNDPRGNFHARGWCYGSAAEAQRAYEASVELSESVARYWKEPAQLNTLVRVYCDACGEPRARDALEKILKTSFGKWYSDAREKVRERLEGLGKLQVELALKDVRFSAGGKALWLYEQWQEFQSAQEKLEQFDPETSELYAEVAHWAQAGAAQLELELDKFHEQLRDQAASCDAMRHAAPPGTTLSELPPILEVPDRAFAAPSVDPKVPDAAGVGRELRYSLRFGLDGQLHLVFANRGSAPRVITFQTQNSDETTVTVPAFGAALAVVTPRESPVPACRWRKWGSECSVRIVGAACASGEVRNKEGACVPECPEGMIGRRAPGGNRCECPPKTWFDEGTRACIPDGACPRPFVAARTAEGTKCECPARKRFDSATRACVDDTCTGDSKFDLSTNRCACPAGRSWSKPESKCIEAACSGGTRFDSDQGRCVCPGNQNWNAGAHTCECPAGTLWFGTHCAVPSCASGMNFDWGPRACVCLSGLVPSTGGGCSCPNPEEMLVEGKCQKLDVAAKGAVTSRDVTITINDYNRVQDDYYDLYVNDAFVAHIQNPPGGYTQIRGVTLKSGLNIIELRLIALTGSSTALELLIEPGPFRQDFAGSRNHRYAITAP